MGEILNFISNIIKPVSSLVDNLHTSEAERETLKARLLSIENQFYEKLLAYETKIAEAQVTLTRLEVGSGSSWLQQNWRPITMLIFVGLFFLDKFMLLPRPMTTDELDLIRLGLTGYIAGRTFEKVVSIVKR